MNAVATAEERAAVDGRLGPPESAWDGKQERTQLDGHVALGGFHRAEEQRHLLLPTLHAVQTAIGWISPGALNYVCERLIVPPAEAYGVASFYALLATDERPPRVAHVCDDIACKARGVDDALAALEAAVGPEGRDAGGYAWMRSPCLGQCEQGSAAFVQIAGGTGVELAPAPPDQIATLLRGGDAGVTAAPTVQVRGRLLRRCGMVDPDDLTAYRTAGGYEALARAIDLGADRVIAEVKTSNLRGRGGAAFPMGVKWEAVAAAEATPHYVVCNADESEPGTFKDRILMEEDPFAVIEATTIAGFATGAQRGYLYVRAEYPLAVARLQRGIDEARAASLLGDDVMGAGFSFDIEIRRGAGAYICGEETALFNSIEGHRGEPRQKPPFPTEAGLFGRPTAVNNVETLVNVLDIVLDGGAAFAAIGTEQSTGPKLFCVSGTVERPGLYEVEFGTTLRQLLQMAGGVPPGLRAVLLGGAAGVFVGPDALDVPLTFEGTREIGASLGSGVVMAFDGSVDMAAITRRIAAFFRDESCGQCVPCRVGTVRQEEALARLLSANGDRQDHVDLIDEIAVVMRDASICGLGHTAAGAIQSAIRLGLVAGGAS